MNAAVRLLRGAVEDLDGIQVWGAETFGAARALAFTEDVIERLIHLGAHPRLGRAGRVAGTREWPLDGTPFVVVYRDLPDRVDVLRILHGRRRWPPG